MSEVKDDNLILNSGQDSVEQIEFLPDWHKQGSQRRKSYRNQYILLAVMFGMILILDSIYTGSLSNARGEIAQNKDNAVRAEACNEEYNELKQDINRLKKYTEILDDIDSEIDIPKVLGEMSFLTGKDIVLSGLEFSAEGFPSLKSEKSGGNSRRISRGGNAKMLGPVRFRISMNGIGADAERIASFVSELENSQYFRDVSLLFTRNGALNVSQTGDKNKMISRFEITCYLANYKITQAE